MLLKSYTNLAAQYGFGSLHILSWNEFHFFDKVELWKWSTISSVLALSSISQAAPFLWCGRNNPKDTDGYNVPWTVYGL